MKNSKLEEENIIKDGRNLFRLEKIKKETIDTAIKDKRNICRLKKKERKRLKTENNYRYQKSFFTMEM